MIKRIKVYGERNSGNNFLKQLLEKNTKNISLCSNFYKDNTGWLHGKPKLNLFENMIDDTLFVFIIRDLESWLKSMYSKPYHFEKCKNINLFLENKLIIKEKNIDHDVHIYDYEKNNTIFELRYLKIKSLIYTFKKVKNAIMVNLEDIQKDKGKKFIKIIHDKFKIDIAPDFIPIIKHTKIKKNIQNRKIDVQLNENIINKYKNKKFENIVNRLKQKYKLKCNNKIL